ncbi:hypothetical protein M5X11_27965 [Paenibacillus alginolyticus]|uniref:hypothetical protein n=1 Tax=Paenibacillus alginolyticus TaxID=59839 RepID=UPI00040ABC8B|nr:hypothetical protein [Paenibacillus alginolyticus]MCY9668714.1 hypothetical protein [Paenibacillus alginolyticus]
MSKQEREEERQSLIAQLQKLDRHGVWTDQQSKNEGYPNLTLREARAKLAEMMDPKNH